MKKIILASIIAASTTFALDIKSIAGTAADTLGINAETIGKQLTDIVKAKAPETAAQAKSLCQQASTYKSFAGIKDGDMMSKAIDICAEKSSQGLEGQVKDAVKAEAVKTAPSVTNAVSNLLGK